MTDKLRRRYEMPFKRTYHLWTEYEDNLLRLNYYEFGAAGMIPILPRHQNRQGISERARYLGLRTKVGPYGRNRPKHNNYKLPESGSEADTCQQ